MQLSQLKEAPSINTKDVWVSNDTTYMYHTLQYLCTGHPSSTMYTYTDEPGQGSSAQAIIVAIFVVLLCTRWMVGLLFRLFCIRTKWMTAHVNIDLGFRKCCTTHWIGAPLHVPSLSFWSTTLLKSPTNGVSSPQQRTKHVSTERCTPSKYNTRTQA